MRKSVVVAGAVGSMFILGALSACGSEGLPGASQQLRDLEGVSVTDPDKVRLVTNVQDYPNAVAICIEGAGFITTTRTDRPLQPVPAWDAPSGWCGK